MPVSVGPHEFVRRIGSSTECARCYLGREDHPTEEWVQARPLNEETKHRPWPLFVVGFALVAILALVLAARGESHLVRTPDHPKLSALENTYKDQTENLYHARYVCRNGGGDNRVWHCRAATGWLVREWRETRYALGLDRPWWIRKQIAVAEKIARAAIASPEIADPWPNCPDPYHQPGSSWLDTLACENRAMVEIHGINSPKAWLDGPGYFRCGLQFKPSWEDVYGRLCP